MKKSKWAVSSIGFILGLFILPASVSGQQVSGVRLDSTLIKAEDTLLTFTYFMIHDTIPDDRFMACHQMIPTLVRGLKTKNSFHYPFEKLGKAVSIQYSQDSSFRIFTWQLKINEDDYRYYGAIQINAPDLKLIPLSDRSFELESPETMETSNKQWYGALYYRILDYQTANGTPYYVLLGFDNGDTKQRRKVIDIVRFRSEREAVFGAPYFVHQDEQTGQLTTKNRVVVAYAADAAVKVNFDENLDMLRFDHLIPVAGSANGDVIHVPDGTYEGYRYDKGILMHIPHVQEQQAPVELAPQPVLNSRSKKNIFGKDQK